MQGQFDALDIDVLAKTCLSLSKKRTDYDNELILAEKELRNYRDQYPEIQGQVTRCVSSLLDGELPRVAVGNFCKEMQLACPRIIEEALQSCEVPVPSLREVRDRDKIILKVLESASLPPPSRGFQECIEHLHSKAMGKQSCVLYAIAMELGFTFVEKWTNVRKMFLRESRKTKIVPKKRDIASNFVVGDPEIHALNIICMLVDGVYQNDTMSTWVLEITLGKFIQTSSVGYFVSVIADAFGCRFWYSEETHRDDVRIGAFSDIVKSMQAVGSGLSIILGGAAILMAFHEAAYNGDYMYLLVSIGSAILFPIIRMLRDRVIGARVPAALLFGLLCILTVGLYFWFTTDPQVQPEIEQLNNAHAYVVGNLSHPNITTDAALHVSVVQKMQIFLPDAEISVFQSDTRLIAEVAYGNDKITLDANGTSTLAAILAANHRNAVRELWRRTPLLPRVARAVPRLAWALWVPVVRIVRTVFRCASAWYRRRYMPETPITVENALAARNMFPDDSRETLVDVALPSDNYLRSASLLYMPGYGIRVFLRYIRDNVMFSPVDNSLVPGAGPPALRPIDLEMANYFVSGDAMIAYHGPAHAGPADSYSAEHGDGQAVVTIYEDLTLLHAFVHEYRNSIGALVGALDGYNIVYGPAGAVRTPGRRLVYKDLYDAVDAAVTAVGVEIPEKHKCLLASYLWAACVSNSTEVFCYVSSNQPAHPIQCVATLTDNVTQWKNREGQLKYDEMYHSAVQQLRNFLDRERNVMGKQTQGMDSSTYKPGKTIRTHASRGGVASGTLKLVAGGGLFAAGMGYGLNKANNAIQDFPSFMQYFAVGESAAITAIPFDTISGALLDVALDPIIYWMEDEFCREEPMTDMESMMNDFNENAWSLRLLAASAAAATTTKPFVNVDGTINYDAAMAAMAHYSMNVVPTAMIAGDALASGAIIGAASATGRVGWRWWGRSLFPIRYSRTEEKNDGSNRIVAVAGDAATRLDELGTLSSVALDIMNEYRTGVDSSAFFQMGIATKAEALHVLSVFPRDGFPTDGMRGAYSPYDWVRLQTICLTYDYVPDARLLYKHARFHRHNKKIAQMDWVGAATRGPILFLGPYASNLYRKLIIRPVARREFVTRADALNDIERQAAWMPLDQWKRAMEAYKEANGQNERPLSDTGRLYILRYYVLRLTETVDAGIDRYEEVMAGDSASLLDFIVYQDALSWN